MNKRFQTSHQSLSWLIIVFLTLLTPACSRLLTSEEGDDCNSRTAIELDRQLDLVSVPPNSRLSSDEVVAAATAYRTLRSFVRQLDIPLLANEQTAYVNALEDFIDGLTKYLQSGGLDLSGNEVVVPLGDAYQDFINAFIRECTN